ncbi:hypothetical protein QP568_09625 [Propionimicrobium lymphophilum]|uniref:hypothetical protein n=1 Tax=Propionimicrobium lymphophilum TaxID=33012 RepID=UPI002550DAC9|nr:hypothetical protein [Propionimicrobium lymphophilum]MDK7710610.1 hypothetical protein [Propionimicrobium lymphophilum]MDK7734541.1 hypothetical protein [Propionimicrobium lymphophilum]
MTKWYERILGPDVVADTTGRFWSHCGGGIYSRPGISELWEAHELEGIYGPCKPMIYESEDTGVLVDASVIVSGLKAQIANYMADAAEASSDERRDCCLERALKASKKLSEIRKLEYEEYKLRGV